MSKLTIIALALFVFSGLIFSQTGTTQWRLIWDANSETDMDYYQIYRSTSQGATTPHDTIHHPGTVYIDQSLEKGTRYYYRLKAVNLSGLSSEYSDEVNAAIPAISIPSQYYMPSDTTIRWTLDNYVDDPDHTASQLDWSIEGASKLSIDPVALSEQRVAVISSNSDWEGSEALTFTVTDPDSFWSASICTFIYSDTPQEPNKIYDIQVEQPAAAGTVVLSWKTTLPSKDSIQYGSDNSYGTSTNVETQFATDHESTLYELEPEQTYHFRIVSLDINGDTISCPDSTFTVKTQELPPEAEDIIVYPNPFYANNEDHTQITVQNLPENGRFLVFDLMGNTVFKQQDIKEQNYQWDVKNPNGREISSGLYIYIIQDQSGNELTDGKLIIVR